MPSFLKKILPVLLACLASSMSYGQAAVWQQRVAYVMDVTLLADQHQLRGSQQVTYVNNSPDTLREVFYHLYFNAFNPTSMMAERNRHLPDPDPRIVPRIWQLGPDEIGYHQIMSLTQDDTSVAFNINDTVMKVTLAAPLLPGDSTVFDLRFHAQVPLQTRRSGRDNREGIDYSMSQWYPKIAEYDGTGWHADPYVGREFYGVLGNNEAAYSWMDEGFTSYAAAEGLTHVLGRGAASHAGATLNVLYLQHKGLAERMNTPADWYTTNTAFGIASYSGGEMLVDLLGYVVSDAVRDAWLRAYYQRFKFRHPTPSDLEKVAEDVSGLRLDWYFEQFANTVRTLDYAVADLDTRRARSGTWTTTLTLHRNDEVVVPVDVRLTFADGTALWVNIPLGEMHGNKPVPADWIVAAPWNWTSPEYTLTLDLPKRATRAEIDPFARTPDRNRLNNTSAFPLRAAFLRAPTQSWSEYEVGLLPLAQYAYQFGYGAGLLARGAYLFGQHQATAMLKLWPQVLLSDGAQPTRARAGPRDGSAFDGLDYTASYTSLLHTLNPPATFTISVRKHLGVLENRVSVTQPLGRWAALGRDPTQTVTAMLMHQYSPTCRAFSVDGFAWFLEAHLVSARLDYALSAGQDRLSIGIEVGSSLHAQSSCTTSEQPSCIVTQRQSPTRLYAAARRTTSTSSRSRPPGRSHTFGTARSPAAVCWPEPSRSLPPSSRARRGFVHSRSKRFPASGAYGVRGHRKTASVQTISWPMPASAYTTLSAPSTCGIGGRAERLPCGSPSGSPSG